MSVIKINLIKYQSNKQPLSVVYFILNSKIFLIVLILSNKYVYLYLIRINLGIRHIALHGLYVLFLNVLIQKMQLNLSKADIYGTEVLSALERCPPWRGLN